ncbi:MAG: hypothetical protein E6I43_09810 [Chloroflexi bacterium]|nr:MAG: hypothetical protein E6I43_09810 [Chloroflexota bacterium]
MATGSAVDLVRACLEHEPPHGLRVGPPQISGTLSLFPIFRDAAGLDYVTLAEAQEAKTVEISELDARGTVSRLVVKNAGASPVLIIDGDILLGLKQDRALNTTILVPSQSTLEIPVSCIEAGRWRPKSATAHRGDFSLSPGARAAVLKSMILHARTSGRFDSDQRAIWNKIEKYFGTLGVASGTHAYSDIERQRRPQIEARLAQLKPADGQSGVLAVVGGKPVSFDLFDKASTLSRFWQGLIGSCITESLATAPSEASVDVEAATGWIRGLGGGKASVHPAVGMGVATLITGAGHDLSALVVEGVPIHIAATQGERSDSRNLRESVMD